MASDPAVKAARPGRPVPRSRGGVLANRDFAKLWAGESVSLIGTQVTTFTMPLVAVLTLNAPVFDVGILYALRFVPVVIGSLFAGVWLDRRRRRPVLIGCALGNAALIALVPIASAAGLLTIGLLYVVTTLAGTLSMIFDVGALSYIPSLVEPGQLTDANSKIQGSTAVAGIAGPGLAGVLIGLITAPVTLSVDAASYLFSALGLLAITTPETRPEAPAEPVSVRQSIAEGLRAVYGNKLLRILLSQSTILNVGFGSLSAVFTVYAVRQLGLSPAELGVTVAGLAVGALCGALSATRIRRALGLGRALAVAIVAVSVSPLLLLIPRSAGLAAILILFAGWLGHGSGISIWNVNTITLRQVVTPRPVLARMNATYRMLLFGALPVGAIIGGILGRVAGLRSALVISVIVLVCPILWTLFSPVFRLTQMPTGPWPDIARTEPADTAKDG